MARQQHTTPLAKAYAQSLLELATEQGEVDPAGHELEDLAKVIESDPAFQTFLTNPSVGHAERERVIETAFRGRVSPLLFNFIGVMNLKGRLGLLRRIATAYAELREEQQGIIEVDVIVAQKLSPEQLDQVRQKVGQALKHEAVVHQYVDESIIGGMVLRVEDRLLDASVRSQLRAIRRQLLAARGK